MCRTLVSVDHLGCVYDCDLNQMLALPLGGGAAPRHLRDLLDAPLVGTAIAVAGDTATDARRGRGRVAGGALTEG